LSASPLSLFVFSLDGQRYALPLSQVESVTQAAAVTRVGQLPRSLLGLLNVHGALLPVLDSRHLIDQPSRPITVDDLFLLLRLHDEGWVLPVDAVHQVLDLAPEALCPGSPRLGQRGCWLGWFERDGDVVLILDLPQMLGQERQLMPDGAYHG
jgi:purine-binding chemotaxis protein CheW